MIRKIAISIIAIACVACTLKTKDEKPISTEKIIFEEHFNSSKLTDDWLDTSNGKYSIINGKLRVQGARNKPLWLKKKLPRDVRLDFTARSVSPQVDIKVELFGDGKSFAKSLSYTATSYVVILGGWNNSRSIIARMDEHDDSRKVRKDPVGQVGKEYKFSLVRKDNLLKWFLDEKLFLEFDDPNPLTGKDHRHFAFNNWESEVYFDDVVITKL